MTVLVLAILALIWAAVLLPPYVQNRRESRPSDSIAVFRAQLSVLERTSPRRVEAAPFNASVSEQASPVARTRTTDFQDSAQPAVPRRTPAYQRRRDVFRTLAGATCATFVLALAVGGAAWLLHLTAAAAFGAYILMLVSLRREQSERKLKVRYLQPLPPPSRLPEPQLLFRRSGT